MIDIIKRNFFLFVKAKQGKNAIIVSVLQVLVLCLNIGSSSLITRLLGAEIYGEYSILINIFLFSIIFSTLGYFASSSSLIANCDNKKREKEIIGSAFLIATGLGVLYSALMFILSFVLVHFYGTEVSKIIRNYVFLLMFLPLQLLILQLAKGTGEILKSAYFSISNKVLFLVGIIIIYITDNISLGNVSFVYLLSITISGLIICSSFKPIFSRIRNNFSNIYEANKSFGKHLFKGQIVDQASVRLDIMVLGLFVEPKQVGLYFLAKQLTEPIYIFSQSISNSFFKSFASSKKVNAEIIIVNILWLVVSSCCLILLGKNVVGFLFGEEFHTVSTLAGMLVFSVIIRGLYVPYNLFLGSKMSGIIMKKASYCMGVSNLFLSFTLIPLLGIYGAIVVNIISYLIYGLIIFKGYRKFLSEKVEGASQ